MTDIKVESIGQFETEIKKIQEILQQKETEHTWQLFDDALKRLLILSRIGAINYEKSLLNWIKSLRQPILDAILTERTRLSGTATELIEEFGKILGPKFEIISDMFVPAILKLCTRTNKIFINRARKCMSTIIRDCQIPSLITKFKESMQGQSKTLRTSAAEFTLTSIEVSDVGNLNNYISDLEWIIREGAVDSTPAVRSVTKKIFEVYKIKFDLRLDDFVNTLPFQVKKNLGVQDRSTTTTTSQRSKIRLQNRIKENQQLQQSQQDNIIIYTKDDNVNGSNDKEWVVDLRLPSKNKENKVVSELDKSNPPSIPVVALSNESTSNTTTTTTTTAQRVPSKSNKINNRENTTGGAQRVKQKDHTSTINVNEEKAKASRVLNTGKTSNSNNNNNNNNNSPLLSRTLSAPTINPSKTKSMHPSIKKKSATVNYNNKYNTKESRSIMNSNPKPTKVTATASSTADGLTTIATISVSISAASSPTTNRSQNASSSRLFNRNKDRQFTPYQKPAIGFASRKFKTRIPDSSELNSKINTYANKLIEELTGQQEVLEEKINKEDIIIEISKLEQNLETESNDSSSRSRLSIKQALPATQVITPIPTEPSPPLSFVNPVKFLEDIHEASENIENNNKENRIINVNGEENEGNKVVLVDVNKVVVCELVEKADEMNIEDK